MSADPRRHGYIVVYVHACRFYVYAFTDTSAIGLRINQILGGVSLLALVVQVRKSPESIRTYVHADTHVDRARDESRRRQDGRTD